MTFKTSLVLKRKDKNHLKSTSKRKLKNPSLILGRNRKLGKGKGLRNKRELG